MGAASHLIPKIEGRLVLLIGTASGGMLKTSDARLSCVIEAVLIPVCINSTGTIEGH
jgi:hypothetical protein